MKKTKALAPRLNPQVAPRERRMDHNTVSRSKRLKPAKHGAGLAETVEQFEARGGQVQRLVVAWGHSDAD